MEVGCETIVGGVTGCTSAGGSGVVTGTVASGGSADQSPGPKRRPEGTAVGVEMTVGAADVPGPLA